MRKASFFRVYNWMHEELHLGGYDLLVYAFIASFPEGYFGTLSYIGGVVGITRHGAHKILKRLVAEGLVKKAKNTENGRVNVVYTCVTRINGVCNEDSQGVKRGSTDNIIYNNKDNKENLIKEKDGKEIPQDREFDFMWKVLGRGDRDKARAEWEMLSEQEKGKARRHITHYVDENKDYCVTLEKYLHNRQFESIVYYNGKGGVRHDPDAPEIDYSLEYHPTSCVYRSADGQYYYDGVFTCASDIRDGLQPNQRPDGQKVFITNNPWIHVEWSAREEKWKIVNDK